jgi:hypothetical protein
LYKVIAKATKLNLIWLLVFMGGCAPASVTMDSAFQRVQVKEIPERGCNIVIGSFEDHRRDKESLGAVAYTEVFSVDPLLWVENGFESFGVVRASTDYVSKLQQPIYVSLKVAHIGSLLSAKTANTVLGLSQDDFETVKYFRGSHASINWSSSSEEIKAAFEISLTIAIQNMIEYINSEC